LILVLDVLGKNIRNKTIKPKVCQKERIGPLNNSGIRAFQSNIAGYARIKIKTAISNILKNNKL
jgi:hypothetical protein